MKTYVILLLVLFCVGCSEPVERPWQSSFPNENLDMNYPYYRSYSEMMPTDNSYLYDYTPRRTAPIKTYNETFPVLEWEVERNRMDIEEMKRDRNREAFMESITGWKVGQ